MKKSLTFLFAGAIALAGSNLYGQKGDAAKGKEVFDQCSVCHNADSTEVKMGPGLKGLFKKDKMTTTGKPVTEATRLWPNQKVQIGSATLEFRRLKTVPLPNVSLTPSTRAMSGLLSSA